MSLIKSLWLIVVTFIVLFNVALAEEIKFKKGESSATIEGTVLRGDRDKYTLKARAGQMMRVSITSLKDNAVFQIYRQVGEDWTPLLNADEGDDTTGWEGQLPGNGNELIKIMVGGIRGNATYLLEVAIE